MEISVRKTLLRDKSRILGLNRIQIDYNLYFEYREFDFIDAEDWWNHRVVSWFEAPFYRPITIAHLAHGFSIYVLRRQSNRSMVGFDKFTIPLAEAVANLERVIDELL